MVGWLWAWERGFWGHQQQTFDAVLFPLFPYFHLTHPSPHLQQHVVCGVEQHAILHLRTGRGGGSVSAQACMRGTVRQKKHERHSRRRQGRAAWWQGYKCAWQAVRPGTMQAGSLPHRSYVMGLLRECCPGGTDRQGAVLDAELG